MFQSYLSNLKFTVNLEDSFSEVSSMSCGVPQGSILGPLLFLIYLNDMPTVVKCNLFLYADYTCQVFQSKNVKDIETQFKWRFYKHMWFEWFADNKLSIYFGDDKTKSTIFTSKRKIKKLQKLEIICNNIRIKQQSRVTYQSCILEETRSEKSMPYKVISKVNARLKILHRNNKYLTPNLHHLLCSALIQPHFRLAQHDILIFLKNWKTEFKLHETNAFVSIYS